METIVLHEGEYVLTSNGSIDFGKITAEMASLILSMNNHKNKNIVYVELRPGEDGDYWSVLSGLVAHEGYLKNKTLLWSKTNNLRFKP